MVHMVHGTSLLRVVVASPSDVAAERNVVPVVIEEINRSVAADRGLRLEAIRWETDAHPGLNVDGPQGLIDPTLQIENSDLLIGIFWKRFGTPTGGAPSGTEHEIRKAIESWRRRGLPQIFIYFNQSSATPESSKDAIQWARVLQFRDEFPSNGLWSAYEGLPHFERILRMHLTNYLRSQFPAHSSEVNSASGTGVQVYSDYFAVQQQLIEEHAGRYVVRTEVQDKFDRFVSDHSCGYFLVYGVPGQGKTSFCSNLIREHGFPHHLAGISGGRSDLRLIFRSLLSQLNASTQAAGSIPDSLPALSKLWEEILIARGRRERLVVVLDGLDELPEETIDQLPLLFPERLTSGVFIVFTARPGRAMDVLLDQIAANPYVRYELKAMNSGELEQMVRKEAPTFTKVDLNQIESVSSGNPLYIRLLLNELQRNASFDVSDLPPNLEGFFRRATRFMQKADNKRATAILALLSVARRPLHLGEMQQITRIQMREVNNVIEVLRPFLVDLGGFYSFYHQSFLDFVVSELVLAEELRDAHGMISEWLTASPPGDEEYRWRFASHHLLESGNYKGLEEEISLSFLVEKTRRHGYAVLEDIECLTKAMLLTQHPSAVERCVGLVEQLSSLVDEDLIREATHAIQSKQSSRRDSGRAFAPRAAIVPGLDFYVTSIAAAEVSADFFEIAPARNGCRVAIGDAPGRGLKSAFVGRFIGNLFRTHHGLETINESLATFDFFERVTMQSIYLDLAEGTVVISNAGHPAMAHFSARKRRCDPLWVPGEPLHDSLRQTRRLAVYEDYIAEVDTGDILVLLTDGLLEYHRMDGNSYGYRFTKIIERMAGCSAQEIGTAIISDWRAHSVDEEYRDDTTLIVMAIRNRSLSGSRVDRPQFDSDREG